MVIASLLSSSYKQQLYCSAAQHHLQMKVNVRESSPNLPYDVTSVQRSLTLVSLSQDDTAALGSKWQQRVYHACIELHYGLITGEVYI